MKPDLALDSCTVANTIALFQPMAQIPTQMEAITIAMTTVLHTTTMEVEVLHTLLHLDRAIARKSREVGMPTFRCMFHHWNSSLELLY